MRIALRVLLTSWRATALQGRPVPEEHTAAMAARIDSLFSKGGPAGLDVTAFTAVTREVRRHRPRSQAFLFLSSVTTPCA